ncbi:hypothetical protein D3C76_1312720 [compost metagenome]
MWWQPYAGVQDRAYRTPADPKGTSHAQPPYSDPKSLFMLKGLRGSCAAICTGLARPCHRFLRWLAEVGGGCGGCLVHGGLGISKEMSEKVEGIKGEVALSLNTHRWESNRVRPSCSVFLIDNELHTAAVI